MTVAVGIASIILGVLLGALLQFARVEDLKELLAAAQERNDRLTEAVASANAPVSVMMPRQPVVLEPSSGWWDTKPPVAQG